MKALCWHGKNDVRITTIQPVSTRDVLTAGGLVCLCKAVTASAIIKCGAGRPDVVTLGK
jgi:hypothetical protein